MTTNVNLKVKNTSVQSVYCVNCYSTCKHVELLTNYLLDYVSYIWSVDNQGCTYLLMSTLFSLGGLLTHPQNPHSWRASLPLSWTPQETMAMRRCRNRSNDLIHGGRWWWWCTIQLRGLSFVRRHLVRSPLKLNCRARRELEQRMLNYTQPNIPS